MIATAPDGLAGMVDAIDLDSMLAEAGEAVTYVDQNWIVRFCNDAYLANIGMSRREVIGRTPFDFVPLFKRSIFYEAFETCRVTRQPMSRIGFSTVLNRWLMVRVFPVGNGVLMLANDASESVVKQQQLAQKALRDPLTELGNKLAMEQQVSELLRRAQPFSVIVLGLDRFKDVNDAHGYALGDMVLLEVASTIQSSTVSGETLYRFSGDEFAVVREGLVDGVSERAKCLIAAVKKPIALAGVRTVLASSAGTVECPKNGDEFELIVKRAGLALRDAKKGGRDGVTAYRTELELATQVRAVLESEFRTALDGNQFALVIQPKVSLTTGCVVGGEALIRWAHPKRGMLAPGVFLGLAEEIGAMVALDQWVLKQALRYCAELTSKGLRVPISINLSVDSLSDMYLADRVGSALAEANVEPGLLEVEIPEGALMHDVKASGDVLGQLHAMGVSISIDDFGTGYSSFAYLARFPVNSLKIDRSFVSELGSSETSRRIVEGMIRLAHSLSLDVIAEGAETDEQLAVLRSMRCDTVQGYVMAKPMPLRAFETFVRERQREGLPNALSI
ncbi:MAG: EAL domain-containing protein [Burkholderiaceae bacterium]